MVAEQRNVGMSAVCSIEFVTVKCSFLLLIKTQYTATYVPEPHDTCHPSGIVLNNTATSTSGKRASSEVPNTYCLFIQTDVRSETTSGELYASSNST